KSRLAREARWACSLTRPALSPISKLVPARDRFRARLDSSATQLRAVSAGHTKQINMRRLRYSVAMSLDGFIAGPHGEYDWIVTAHTIDFTEIHNQFDIALMGRRTFELACQGPGAEIPGMQTVVCSRTLPGRNFHNFTIIADAPGTVAALKAKPGKDIWLFG